MSHGRGVKVARRAPAQRTRSGPSPRTVSGNPLSRTASKASSGRFSATSRPTKSTPERSGAGSTYAASGTALGIVRKRPRGTIPSRRCSLTKPSDGALATAARRKARR
jgi:hypothetical protein